MRRALLGLVLVLSTGCAGGLAPLYVLRGYDVSSPGAVERVAVGAWAPAENLELAALLAEIAKDFIKLRKSYLVYGSAVLERDYAAACAEEVEGVLALRVLDLETRGDEVSLHVEANLYRCADGALLWRSAGKHKASTRDPALPHLTEAYAKIAGDEAHKLATPLFVLAQKLLWELPDPKLDEDEILEKIERDL